MPMLIIAYLQILYLNKYFLITDICEGVLKDGTPSSFYGHAEKRLHECRHSAYTKRDVIVGSWPFQCGYDTNCTSVFLCIGNEKNILFNIYLSIGMHTPMDVYCGAESGKNQWKKNICRQLKNSRNFHRQTVRDGSALSIVITLVKRFSTAADLYDKLISLTSKNLSSDFRKTQFSPLRLFHRSSSALPPFFLRSSSALPSLFLRSF